MNLFLFGLLIGLGAAVILTSAQQPNCCSQQPYILQQVREIEAAISGGSTPSYSVLSEMNATLTEIEATISGSSTPSYSVLSKMNATLTEILAGVKAIDTLLSAPDDKSAFKWTYSTWLPLFGPDDPLGLDYTNYPDTTTQKVTNGLEDIKIGSAASEFGLGFAIIGQHGSGDSTTHVLDGDQLVFGQALGKPLTWRDTTTWEGSQTTALRLVDAVSMSYVNSGEWASVWTLYAEIAPSINRQSEMTTGGCAENDLLIRVRIKATQYQNSDPVNWFAVQMRPLLGLYDGSTENMRWVELGSLTILEAENKPSNGWNQFNCGGTTDGGCPHGTECDYCFISYCLNPASIFRPSLILPIARQWSAAFESTGGDITDRIMWPTTGYNAFTFPTGNLMYGSVAPNSFRNGTQNFGGTTLFRVATPDMMPRGAAPMSVYVCSTAAPPSVILAKGQIWIRNTGTNWGSYVETWATFSDPAPTIEFVEWLDFEWDKTFDQVYSKYYWQNFDMSWQDDNTMYIATDLDLRPCEGLGDQIIPQQFWALTLSAFTTWPTLRANMKKNDEL
jgi:hypothetical protein